MPKGRLVFEQLKTTGDSMGIGIQRARVPGGWLVVVGVRAVLTFKDASLTFYPDPEHAWDGNSPLEKPVELKGPEESDNRSLGSRWSRIPRLW